MTKTGFEKTSLLGVRVDLVSLDELIEFILTTVRDQSKAVIAYVNVHAVNTAGELGWFKDFINQAQVVFCDGFGVKWAVNFLNGRSVQRLTPPDWFGRLAGACAEQGISMYFLGTRQEVVEKAAAVLKESHPRLTIAGVHHGFFNKERTSAENQEVAGEINALRPNILVVGFGMPAQEKWIMENLDQLQVNVVIPVGAFFDYQAGAVVRAPRWMTDHGLEWLGRLLIEPRRLGKRYLLENPRFIWRVLLQKIKKTSVNS